MGKAKIISGGLQQAKANLEISGSVIVTADNGTGAASLILFTVRNAIAGTPIDMTPNGVNTTGGGTDDTSGSNRCVISLTTANAYFNNIPWNCEFIGDADSDNLLDSGEQLEITIDLADVQAAGETTGTWQDLGTNDWFNIQVKPMLGSTMTVQRTLPAGLDALMDLH